MKTGQEEPIQLNQRHTLVPSLLIEYSHEKPFLETVAVESVGCEAESLIALQDSEGQIFLK